MTNVAVENLRVNTTPVIKTRAPVEIFMEAAALLGAEFLACGGPVTRLEAQLSAAGCRLGFDTTIHATPSSISIFCHDPVEHESSSRGQRIQSFGVDLGRLRIVDKLLGRFASGEIRQAQVVCQLNKKRDGESLPVFVHFASIFGIGAGAGILMGASFLNALECGVFSALIQALVFVIRRFFAIKPMFADFISCFFAFLLSPLATHFLGMSSQLLAVGTLIYVVPGLLMTTAISEIVDQNYLSGTIRLLKALCTFMSMALAYYLAMDLVESLNIGTQSASVSAGVKPTYLGQMSGSAIILLCSSLEFRVNLKLLPRVLLCGLAGASCYFAMHTSGILVMPHFFAAFAIGFVSYWMSRRYNHPSQIYSVPSVLILAPGMLAFSSFGYGTAENLSVPSILKAALISLSIVFGLAAGRLPFRR
jgi:uncharacterized membrane protein YjjP (DUF1212 family)